MNIRTKILNLGVINRIFGKRTVHVEAAHLKRKELIKHIKKYKSKCYCICPSNYHFVQSNIGIPMSLKEYEKSLKECYLELKNLGINLQLHVHLSMFPEYLSNEEKKGLIIGAYNFFKTELKIIPKEIVFGWYASDKESEEMAHRLNLKIIKEHLHVYDWWMK